MSETVLGVIGGTGLYSLDGLTEVNSITVETPFGAPSSSITSGKLGDIRLLFIARHGQGHVYTPSEVNYRANIYALKALGAEWCLSISAVGSLKENLHPGHLVIPDQFIDRTQGRAGTFFGNGVCAHVGFGVPICPVLQELVFQAAKKVAVQFGAEVQNGGLYVCMEGPAFSTRAESHLHRSWGADLIGMTALPEAKLAREAELGYAILALVTDYDCWRDSGEEVAVGGILEVLRKNIALSKQVVTEVVKALPGVRPSELAANALTGAFTTAPEFVPERIKEDLRPIIGRYFS